MSNWSYYPRISLLSFAVNVVTSKVKTPSLKEVLNAELLMAAIFLRRID
jgi:hypothetical protein